MEKSNLQFSNPYLEEVYFKENADFKPNGKLELQNTFNVEVKKSNSQDVANVSLTLEISKENKNVPFELKITISADFKWEHLDEQTVNYMLNKNAPALLLGYLRPIVSNITNSSRLPVYNLPFFDFTK